MPNHITNVLSIVDGDAGQVLRRIRNGDDNNVIDFNRIVQMPEIMESQTATPSIETLARFFCGDIPARDLLQPPVSSPADAFSSGNYGEAADALERAGLIRTLMETKLAGDFSDDDFETLVKYMRAFRQFGSCNWYEWSRKNWGTKWNAYNQFAMSDRCIKFDTAWSTPFPIWLKLSEMFPEHEFRVQWADEDFGANTGDMRLQNGEVTDGGPFESTSSDAYRNAVEILYDGELPEYYRWNENGTVDYVGD